MEGDTYAFIVRIWHETQDDEGNIVAWRGSIDHVGSDQRLYFQEMEGILRFIEEQTGVNAGLSGSKWRALLARIRNETA